MISEYIKILVYEKNRKNFEKMEKNSVKKGEKNVELILEANVTSNISHSKATSIPVNNTTETVTSTCSISSIPDTIN